MDLNVIFPWFKDHYSVLRIVVLSGFLAGLIFQVYDMCTMYFSYPITVSVVMEQLTNLSLPAFTICFNHVDILSKSKLIRAFPRLKRHLEAFPFGENETDFYEDMTIKALMMTILIHYRKNSTIGDLDNLTLNYRETFTSCSFLGKLDAN